MQASQQARTGAGSPLNNQDVRWFLLMCAYVAFFFAGCGATLLRCIPLSATVVLLHAALRRAPSEHSGRGDNVPGVPFRCCLFFLLWAPVFHASLLVM